VTYPDVAAVEKKNGEHQLQICVRLSRSVPRTLDDQENRVDALKKAQSDYQARQARAERELNDLIAAMTFDVTP
jgi:hypothetical protein